MYKRGIILDLKGLETFESVPTKFGNGSHILIPKKYSNQNIKIIVGKHVNIRKEKIEIELFGNEILERKPSKFGTSFHIIIPKKFIGKKIKFILEEKNE